MAPEVSPPALEVRSLGFAYGPGARGLEDLSFSLGRGKVLGLAGPSGSGKSTLLGLLKGFLRPRSGQILLDGQAEGQPRGKPRLRDTVGLVFQYPERQLFASTLGADLAFGLRRKGLGSGEVAQRVDTALDSVGLDPGAFRGRSPFELSGGEKRRAALAAILVLEPQVLLLDEPTAGLDAQASATILSLVDAVASQGRSVILVSHEVEELLGHTQSLLVLEEGRALAQGPTEALLGDQGLAAQTSCLASPRLDLLRRLQARGFSGGLRAGPEAIAAFLAAEGSP